MHDEPTPPALIGLNYYVTSDRFLDDRLDRYPRSRTAETGGNVYADVDAVRVAGIGLRGHAAVLPTLDRYGVPVAITEAHLGCTREEQMRWLAEAWQGAHDAAAQGADVRAVTAWALLGSWDWDSLLTRGDADHYETGAFDVRGGDAPPDSAGRRHRRSRGRPRACTSRPRWSRDGGGGPVSLQTSARPMLITGANGTLGRAFVQACETRGLRLRRAGAPRSGHQPIPRRCGRSSPLAALGDRQRRRLRPRR